jgi:hypothetical protein
MDFFDIVFKEKKEDLRVKSLSGRRIKSLPAASGNAGLNMVRKTK